MSNPIQPVRVNHMNVVLQDFDNSLEHVRGLYAADFLADIPQPEMHAGLFEIGRVIFELFVPHAYLLNARYGPHYVGLEYQADMETVRETVAAHGIRIIRDIGLALHTHPEDCFGVAFEFYGGYFHDREWAPLGGQKMKSAEYYRNEHPLGLAGLKAYSIAVHDIGAAQKFIQSFLGGEVAYEAARPAAAARAIGLQVADCVIELITPVEDGALLKHLHRFGEGIRSTVFGVRDIEQAKRYFKERDIALVPGDAPNALAIPAESNLGIIFEFAE